MAVHPRGARDSSGQRALCREQGASRAASAHDLTGDERARIASAESRLDQAEMIFTRVPPGRLLSAAKGSAPKPGSLLVLDSSSDWDADSVADLKTVAEVSDVWLVAVVPDTGKGRRAARPTVRAGADLHVWVERDDQHEPESPRTGEADLAVTQAGRSRSTMVTVVFQGHYSRFVDMRPT